MVSRRSRQVSVLEECLYGCYYAAPDEHIPYQGNTRSPVLRWCFKQHLSTAADQATPDMVLSVGGGHTTNNVSSSTDPVTVDNKEDMK